MRGIGEFDDFAASFYVIAGYQVVGRRALGEKILRDRDGLFARAIRLPDFDVNSEFGGCGLHCRTNKLPEFRWSIGVNKRDLNVTTPRRPRGAEENYSNEKAA
jgi:hypothetical protein